MFSFSFSYCAKAVNVNLSATDVDDLIFEHCKMTDGKVSVAKFLEVCAIVKIKHAIVD